MIMSALANIDMSSSLIDCRLFPGGPDGRRGQGDHECEGTQAGACDPPRDGAEDDSSQGRCAVGLTTRQVRRLIERVEQEGDQGLAHRGRGTPSNRRMSEPVKATVLRLWLRDKGIDHVQRRPRPHRAWRERRPHVGEWLQLDGSHHDGFEGRGPRCVLMASIDDASSRVYARFYEYEGTIQIGRASCRERV